MTKKELLTKMEEYQSKLDAASEDSWRKDLLIKDLEKTVETLNGYITDLKTKLDAASKALDNRLEFEKMQLEIFTSIIHDYQGGE